MMTAKKKASSTLSKADATAQSMLKLKSWIEQVDQAERASVGTWMNVPQEFTSWVFMRCGLRGVDRAESLAMSLRQMGYTDAPRGVRCVGFETDGERGLYLMIPQAGYKVLQERKRGVRRSVASATTEFERQMAGIDRMGSVTTKVQTQRSELKIDV